MSNSKSFLPYGITPRVTSVTDDATANIDADTTDIYDLTACANATEFQTPTGTPANGQKLIIRIRDAGVAKTITWQSGYTAGGVALPSTTVAGKTTHCGFIYNTANSLNKWMLVASVTEA